MGFGSGRPAPPLERLWRHIRIENDCWIWTGASQQFSNGRYGNFNMGGGRYLRAHRASYEMHVGPIPDGLVLDHLCRNTLCVNPEHLEAVTQRENVLRGVGENVLLHNQGRCKRGHPVSESRLYPPGHPRAGRVAYCCTCRRERRR